MRKENDIVRSNIRGSDNENTYLEEVCNRLIVEN